METLSYKLTLLQCMVWPRIAVNMIIGLDILHYVIISDIVGLHVSGSQKQLITVRTLHNSS